MELEDFFVLENDKMSYVLKRMNVMGHGILLVGNMKHIEAVITDGDIRRYWLLEKKEKGKACDIANYKPVVLKISEASRERISFIFNERKIKALPIISDNGELQRIEFDNGEVIYKRASFDTKVVIMAGGKGTRLMPLTDVLPKPLIPVGNKVIIEHIIDQFSVAGFWDFNIIINYKKELIKAFFSKDAYYNKNNIDISLWEEKAFQGTAGGLKLLQDEIKSTFILSNCDILVNADYESAIKEHKQNGNFITVVCAPQKIQIPYGTIKTNAENEVIALEEKPLIECIVNTGLYVIEPQVIELIEDEEFIHLTDLICRCIKKGYKVGTYKIMENGWMDMGEISKLKKMEDTLIRE